MRAHRRERRDPRRWRDVRYRPLRAAGPGSRLWKRSGRGHCRDWRLFVGHGRRGRRQQWSALPGRRSRQRWGPSALPEKAPLSPARWGRLGGRRRVPCGARQRWIHPGAGRRDRADVRQRSAGRAKESFRVSSWRSGSSPSSTLEGTARGSPDRPRALPCFRLVAELRVGIADGDQVLGVAFLGIRRLPLPQRLPPLATAFSLPRRGGVRPWRCESRRPRRGGSQRKWRTLALQAPCADRSRGARSSICRGQGLSKILL